MAGTDTWMPLYIGDYLRDTAHLSGAEHGAYLLLLMHAWTHDGGLPTDPEKLRRIARMDGDEWDAAGSSVTPFFIEVDGVLRNKRLDLEIERAKGMRKQRQDAGISSAEARKRNRQSNETATEGQRNANENPTSVEIPLETRRTPSPSQPQRKKEPPSVDAGASPIDIRQKLWTEGLATFRSLTGKPEAASRAVIGRLCKAAGDDCAVVMGAITRAASDRPGDLVAWLMGVVKADAEGDTPEFLAFWSAYPAARRDGKGAARQAWAGALRKAPDVDVMAGLSRYQFNSDPKFVPMPATWLNEERWTTADAGGQPKLSDADRRRMAAEALLIQGVLENDRIKYMSARNSMREQDLSSARARTPSFFQTADRRGWNEPDQEPTNGTVVTECGRWEYSE